MRVDRTLIVSGNDLDFADDDDDLDDDDDEEEEEDEDGDGDDLDEEIIDDETDDE